MTRNHGRMTGGIMLVLVVFTWAAGCGGGRSMEIPGDAIILGETTVATIKGYRVGSGNFYERADDKNVRRMSIQIAIWRPDGTQNPKTRDLTLFEGDTFDIGGTAYKLILAVEGKRGDTGKAYIIPVK
jgi:hypothetical protein